MSPPKNRTELLISAVCSPRIIGSCFDSFFPGGCASFRRVSLLCFNSVAAVAIADLFYVVACLFVRRNFVSEPYDCTFASVVTCQHQVHAVIESIQELTQISSAT